MNLDQVKELNASIEAVKGREIDNIYFVACGGSKAIFDPAQYIFDRESAIPTFVFNANEFIHRCPKGLGEKSLVVTCSHSGNTLETTRATQLANDKGALTISFSFQKDSPLWNATQNPISYTWGPESDPGDSNNPMLYRLVFGILNVLQPNEKYERAIKCCDNVGAVFAANKALFAERAEAFGAKYKNEKLIYTMSSGPCYGVAYSFAICLLQEMQWIHSEPIHTGEFFHGPFEVTDADVPFIVLKNYGADCDDNVKANWITEYGADYHRPLVALDSAVGEYADSMNGETRVLDVRAEAFIKRFSDKVITIDCNEFDMNGIDEDLRGYFAVLVAGVVLRSYADTIAYHRGHPLSVRRYMWCMEY
ncbi:MAG: SIS domain-containing protein [Clostridia bacterium]|nr:SIS domain-containing protein [Clostridia bacterium]